MVESPPPLSPDPPLLFAPVTSENRGAADAHHHQLDQQISETIVPPSAAENNSRSEEPTLTSSATLALSMEAGRQTSRGNELVSVLQKPDAQKTSWARIVSNKPSLTKHTFATSSVDGVIDVPDEVLDDAPLWNDLLVGQFISTAPHVAKIHMIVNKIWPLGDKSVKIDCFVVSDKMVKFRIREEAVRSRVLRRGMWNIADVPMLVSKWTPILEEAQPTITTMPLWVTIKNVPQNMLSWKGLGFLASHVGTPKRLHPDTETCKRFDEGKVFVEADMMKELPKEFKFRMRNGKETMVTYSYPWLPPRCTICGKWGHFAEGCKAPPTNVSILKRRKSITQEPVAEQMDEPEIVRMAEELASVEQVEQVLQPLTETMLEKLEVIHHLPQALFRNSEKEGSSEDSSQPTCGVVELVQTEIPNAAEGIKVVPVNDTKIIQEKSWIEISPNKAGRPKEKDISTPLMLSPSRFSVLEEEENQDEDMAKSEEQNHGVMDREGAVEENVAVVEDGAIRETETGDEPVTEPETGELSPKMSSLPPTCGVWEDSVNRSSLPRASKSAHKILTDGKPRPEPLKQSQTTRASRKKR